MLDWQFRRPGDPTLLSAPLYFCERMKGDGCGCIFAGCPGGTTRAFSVANAHSS